MAALLAGTAGLAFAQTETNSSMSGTTAAGSRTGSGSALGGGTGTTGSGYSGNSSLRKACFRVGYEPVVRFRTPKVFTLHIRPN